LKGIKLSPGNSKSQQKTQVQKQPSKQKFSKEQIDLLKTLEKSQKKITKSYFYHHL
jgi:hypothetical protein